MVLVVVVVHTYIHTLQMHFGHISLKKSEFFFFFFVFTYCKKELIIDIVNIIYSFMASNVICTRDLHKKKIYFFFVVFAVKFMTFVKINFMLKRVIILFVARLISFFLFLLFGFIFCFLILFFPFLVGLKKMDNQHVSVCKF